MMQQAGAGRALGPVDAPPMDALTARLSSAEEAIRNILSKLTDATDRLIGADVKAESTGGEVRPFPPAGGALFEAHNTLQRIEILIDRLAIEAQRVDNLSSRQVVQPAPPPSSVYHRG